MNKSPLYRNKSVSEVVAMNPADTLAVNSVNKYLNRISSLFDWALNQRYVSLNPFSGLGLKKSKRAHEEKDEFSQSDLAALFGSEIFAQGEFRHPYYYWLPLLGLYTGARLEEVCQLHLDDIRKEGEVWVIDINEQDEKAIKTGAGRRLVPIHSELQRLGLLEYVDELRSKGETRLFPELKRQRDGYSQAAQKWFNGRYRHACGVSHRKTTFHSFRHTFINYLKQKDQDEKQTGALAGHSDSSVTTGRYGKPYPPETLIELVKIVDFGLALPKVFKAP
ncbi:MAG: site-specific integrase [Proteobacteria bacterium]|nr:site-specific integrase [Pseudomonadota bacterium]